MVRMLFGLLVVVASTTSWSGSVDLESGLAPSNGKHAVRYSGYQSAYGPPVSIIEQTNFSLSFPSSERPLVLPRAFSETGLSLGSEVSRPITGTALQSGSYYAAVSGSAQKTLQAIDKTAALQPVPLPFAIWLLAAGLLGFGAVGYRRRKS